MLVIKYQWIKFLIAKTGILLIFYNEILLFPFLQAECLKLQNIILLFVTTKGRLDFTFMVCCCVV